MALMDTVRKTIQDHDLIHTGDHIVLGLSGGPDSVCLFHVLQRLAAELDLTIHPVHINHQFRPGDAEWDQAYVEKLCAEASRRSGRGAGAGSDADAGLDSGGELTVGVGPDAGARPTPGSRVTLCRSFVVDVNAMARELGMTSEEAGRKARYDAFAHVAQEIAGTEMTQEIAGPEAAREAAMQEDPAPARPESCVAAQTDPAPARPDSCVAAQTAAAPLRPAGRPQVRIAVAQNANDQAETILHRILRGTGTDGLSGIAYKRSEQGIPVIRPLLDVPRSEIEQYCDDNDLHPVIDHTNHEPIYTRNRIRLEVLPLLQEYNPNIISALARLSRIAASDREYLWQKAEEAYGQLRQTGAAANGKEAGDGAGMGSESGVSGNSRCRGDAAEKSAPGAGGPIVLDRQGLADLPEAIRHRVVARAFMEAGLTSDISEERLRAADTIISKKQAPKTVEFPRGHRLTVKKGRVIIS